MVFAESLSFLHIDMSVQFSSVAQSCPALCNPMNCSRPGLPIHHQLPESTKKPCALSWWCHPTISSSVIPFSWPQSLPAFGSFQMSQLFASGDQSIGASASASVLPMNSQCWFPLGYTGCLSLLSKGLSRVFSNTAVEKHQFSALSFLYRPTLTSIHDYWKNIAFTRWALICKVMSLLFNMLSRLVIIFLPRSKCLLISWLLSPSAVILEPRKIKSTTVSAVSPSICHEMMWLDAMILLFWMWSFKPTFPLSSFTFIEALYALSIKILFFIFLTTLVHSRSLEIYQKNIFFYKCKLVQSSQKTVR